MPMKFTRISNVFKLVENANKPHSCWMKRSSKSYKVGIMLWFPVWGVRFVSGSFDFPRKPHSSNPYPVSSFGGMVTVSKIPNSIGFPSSCGTDPTPEPNLQMDPCWKQLPRPYDGVITGAQVKKQRDWMNKSLISLSVWELCDFVCAPRSLDVTEPQDRMALSAGRRQTYGMSLFAF